MHACNPTPAHIVKGNKHESFQSPRNQYKIDQMKLVSYTSVVESLMYAQVYTSPDLAFVTGMLERYKIKNKIQVKNNEMELRKT
jgi:hypothetical protein